jgi:proteasome component ECM29
LFYCCLFGGIILITLQYPTRSGLSLQLTDFITHHGKANWTHNSQELQKIRNGVLVFLSSPHFLSKDFLLPEKYALFLWASCDSNYEVASSADSAIKHLGKPHLENSDTIRALFDMYQGTLNIGKGNNS